jgi:hypothetical protein
MLTQVVALSKPEPVRTSLNRKAVHGGRGTAFLRPQISDSGTEACRQKQCSGAGKEPSFTAAIKASTAP